MLIELRMRGLKLADQDREIVERRLRFALSRFTGHLERTRVRLEDTNGPKGGIDKRVQLQLIGPRFGSITLEEMHSDLVTALDLAAERASRTLVRTVERQRQRMTGPTIIRRRAS